MTKPKQPPLSEDSKGILELDGVQYVFEIKNGQRYINNMKADVFIKRLPLPTMLRIIIQAVSK